jgi:RNA recognition motif-containing protein
MAVRLFVGNLPYDASEEEIRTHFSAVGTLSYVSIPLDRETGKKRGFAFVEFADAQQAQEAIRQFNNQPFKGRPLAVNEARAREAGPRPPRPMAPPMRAPAPDFSDPGAAERDRPARKNFGPDSKPARSRTQRFKPESGKRALKEKFTGQIFGPDDEDDFAEDTEIDNFATGLDDDKED